MAGRVTTAPVCAAGDSAAFEPCVQHGSPPKQKIVTNAGIACVDGVAACASNDASSERARTALWAAAGVRRMEEGLRGMCPTWII